MSLLAQIRQPSDLRSLSNPDLVELAQEIREFLIRKVSKTGGHLGPNLGVVELTLALHRVFHSPTEPIIFDTGHQSYVHKLVTGRANRFETLRQKNGLSGYPSREESPHDWVENSHASASLSWAAGIAQGFRLRGEKRCVVAVIGDGALTGGMAWEALNNIAAQPDLPLVIVVNDNGRSYTPTVGGLAKHLSGLRTDRRYEKTLAVVKRRVRAMPILGRPAYDLLHGMKAGVKDVLSPQGMFSDLGIKYLGPVDGHDIGALMQTLGRAKAFGGPVIVHAITQKGRGFAAAEENVQDHFHAVGQIDSATGEPLSIASHTWTDVFADEIVNIAEANSNVVAITAAMLHPTGLGRLAAAHPERVIDVGIAEQHATTLAAGLAATGLHPVFAVYSTFLNRAFDQVLLDVALHKAGVTFVLDRSGVTGPDGASHNGMWDVSLLALVPGLHLAAPRDEETLRLALNEAVAITDAPSVVRYSKEKLPDPIPAIGVFEGLDMLAGSPDAEVLVVGLGQFARTGLEVADLLEKQGIPTRVVDPHWVLPLPDSLVRAAEQHRMVVVLEDNLSEGGVGDLLARRVSVPVSRYGIPKQFLEHANRAEIIADIGLQPGTIASEITARYLELEECLEPAKNPVTPI